MTIKLAKFLSYILHPVFMPLYLILIFKTFTPLPLFYSFFAVKSFIALLVIVFLYTTVFPIGLVLWLRKSKAVSDIEISNPSERPKVYLITSAFYIALGYFLYSKGGLLEPTSFLIIIMVINIIGLAIISLKEKISAHISALAGILGMCFAIYLKYAEQTLFIPILGIILILGLLSSARLILGAHNQRQVIGGLVWGSLTGFIGIIYLF